LPVETKAQKDRNVIPFSGTYIHLVGGKDSNSMNFTNSTINKIWGFACRRLKNATR
jgi:hypothetical protein